MLVLLVSTLCLHLNRAFPVMQPPRILNNAVEIRTTYEYSNFITGPTPPLPDNKVPRSLSMFQNADEQDSGCRNQQQLNNVAVNSPEFETEVKRRMEKLTERYNRLSFRAHRPLLRHQLKNKVSFLRRVLGNLGQDPHDQGFTVGELGAARNIPIRFIRALNRVAGETHSVLGYLLAFGYLDLPTLDNDEGEVTPCQLENALTEFQRFNNLDVTGKLDRATYEKLKSPRCGVPEYIRRRGRVTRDVAGGRSKRHVLRRRGWKSSPMEPLTYYIKNCTSSLPLHICRREITLGIMKWTEVAPIFLREVDESEANTADFTLYFVSGEHPKKDLTSPRNDSPFDGPGGVYAHAYFPRGGHIHFDNDERFTAHSISGFNLQFVAMHEMGHALGLEHSDVSASVMSPHYEPFDIARRHGWKEVLRLKEDDKAGIREKYGHGRGYVIPL